MRTGWLSQARARPRTRNSTQQRTDRALALRHAVALGLLHGPTELLPVSSSAHTTLVPWLAGWPYAQLHPSQRKSFEVALHAGTAAGLLLRDPGKAWPGTARSAGVAFLLPAVATPALAGYLLGERIERRLGTPPTIAAGLLAGSAALLSAELRANRRSSHTDQPHVTHTGQASAHPPVLHAGDAGAHPTSPRAATDAGPRDGLALGIAQALALIPGVSRSGASLAAARARGFSRRDADRLSWTGGLPVIAGAALLQGTRLTRAHAEPQMRVALAAGAGASLLSTLLSARLLSSQRRAALLPACIAYRSALALLTIRRVRDNTRCPPPISKK